MSRRRLPWLVAIPLMVAGSVSAHGLSYRIVAPDANARAALLHDTGHGYLDHASLALGTLLAALVVGLGLRALSAARARAGPRLSASLFFALPPVGFAFQEHLERLLHEGVFPLTAALEPTFLVGLLLQVPFALAAYAVAWVLLEVAERIGSALALPAPPRRLRAPVRLVVRDDVLLPRLAAVSLGHAQRGPPLPAR